MTAELKPKLSKQYIRKLASYYGIQSFMINQIHEFESYDDQVFHVDIKNRYSDETIFPVIIKCTILRELNRIDLWIKLAKHMLKHNLPTPKPVLLLKKYATKHPYIYLMKDPNDDDKTIRVHCIQFINGNLANNIKHTPIFLRHLGSTIAKIHSTLIDNQFIHPNGIWKDEWCLGDADMAIDTISNLPQILDHDRHKMKIVKRYLNYFRLYVKPKMDELPQCIILGDINDTNIICDAQTANIIAVFDFGESHLTAKIFDLCISCAYFMIGKDIEHGLVAMMNIIKGYHNILPLQTVEIDVVFIGIMTRILISAVLGIRNAKQNPNNPWLLHHSIPAWSTLNKYLNVNPHQITNMIRKQLYDSSL